MKKQLIFIVGLVLWMGTACTKKDAAQPQRTPEQVVREFIQLSSEAKLATDKQKLEKLCAGEMRRTFERMTDEVFQLSYLNNNINVKNIEFLKSDSETAQNQAVVRYKVTIENNGGTDPTSEINEREVELTLNSGEWLLENIRPRGQDSIAFTRGMIF